MDPNARAVAIVVALVLSGLGLGIFIGGLGGPGTETIVETVEVTEDRTVTRTVTRTRTVTAQNAQQTVTTGPDGFVTTSTIPAGGCSPAYSGACVPAGEQQVSCSQIPDRDFSSVADDPYALDPDEDGIACED